MPIVVNTNISSINAQRSLTNVNRTLDQALERLASGLRINSAGDDAAGLAIANGLSSQVRGLGQAVRNSQDGLSLIGTAEGAVSNQNEILQRIRELAVQAANDINSADNRSQIQEEITAQISELTRIGNTVEFNGQSLIDGSFTNKKLQVGAFASQTVSVSIGDFRAAAMGNLAQSDNQTAILSTLAIDASNTLSLNGVSIAGSAEFADQDIYSTANVDGSAISKAAAINASYGQTGVRATALEATVSGTAAVAGTTTIAATQLSINGIEIHAAGNAGVAFLANDSNGALRNLINSQSSKTGVVASLDGSNKLVLTAADGRNIQVTGTGTNLFGNLGVGVTAGQMRLTSNESITVTTSNAALVGFANAAVIGLDSSKKVSTIDVTTQAGAESAIEVIDSALSEVATAQAYLGAITNRLENTITNLEVSIENLSASESRIRDADFAAETASLTRAQIIQQSSVSVLSQANLRPQAALSLLG